MFAKTIIESHDVTKDSRPCMVMRGKNDIGKYAGSGRGAGLRLFSIMDDEQKHYAVIAIDVPRSHRAAGVVILARVVEQGVIIEEDRTDKPLVDALLQRGIPRGQVMLAYQGEETFAESPVT
jgi:hypothetical protein